MNLLRPAFPYLAPRQAFSAVRTAFVLLALVFPGFAQQTGATENVSLASIATGEGEVPPNNTVDISFTLEESASKPGEIVISTEIPAVAISLVLPSGVEITQNNAISLGALYEQQDLRDLNAPAAIMTGAVLTRIILFPGAGPGVAKIRATSTGVAQATRLAYLYRPSAGMRIGLAPGALVYRPNSVVRLSAAPRCARGRRGGARIQYWRACRRKSRRG